MTDIAPSPSSPPTVLDNRSLLERLRYTPLLDVLRGRITGRLHIAREIEQAHLPAPLSRLVLDVVRRTRLWRTEKADVAAELIAHFRDGIDSGAAPAELAGMFGDPTRAAKLIRRAKKRNRPLLWRAMRNTVRAAAVMIAILLALYLVMAARFLAGGPSPSVDYRPELNANALALAEADRAWPKYREAFLQLKSPPLEPQQPSGSVVWNRPARPGEEGWEALAQYLQEQQAGLALAREAAAMPGLGYVADYGVTPEDQKLWPGTTLITEADSTDGLFSILLPYLANMRNLARTFQLDIERSAAAGDGATVAADIAAMLGIARHTRELSLFINDLVSLAIFSMTMDTIGDVLSTWSESLTDAQLQEMAHRVAAWDDSTLRVRLDGDRIGFDDILQRIYTDDGHGDGRVTLAGLRKLATYQSITASAGALDIAKDPVRMLAAPALCELMLGRRAMRAEFERMINIAAAEASRPLWQHVDDRFDREIEAMAASPVERHRKWPIVMLMPAIGQGWRSSEKAMLVRDAILTALALELFHRQHHAWPVSLDDLIPSLLPSIPIDRFDGKPLKYAIVNGSPIVYSVARDQDDDGGRELPGGDRGALRITVQRWQSREAHARNPVGDYGDWIIWPTAIEKRYKFSTDDP